MFIQPGQFRGPGLKHDDDVRRIPPALALEHKGEFGKFAPQPREARTEDDGAGRRHRGGVKRRR